MWFGPIDETPETERVSETRTRCYWCNAHLGDPKHKLATCPKQPPPATEKSE